MARTQVNSPLENAAPALQPTARALSIPIGATPPPDRSPLMELGNAFKDFNPELRDMLRDASAREEQNAQALGEITATKARAEGRMAELDKILKQKVDAGELSSVHLPAAQRGASIRSGMEAAETGFQTDILQALPNAIKGDSKTTEQIIAASLKKYADAIPESDFYARKGFDHASQQVIESFRQRVAQGQAMEFDRVHREQLSDVGSELAVRLATADEEAAPTAHADFLRHIDSIRQELPKSEVNGFVMEHILTPAISRLTDEHKFAEARQLLDESAKLDVTGKGGLLSQTSVAKETFRVLSDRVDRESRADTHLELDSYKADRELRILKGADEAGAQLQKLRLNAGGSLPLENRFNLINEYRIQNSGDPVKVDAFAQAVNSEYENEDRFRSNERVVSDLALQANTLDKAKLATAENAVEAQYKAGAVPASARTQLLEVIDKRRALAGSIDEQDFRSFKKNVFSVSQGNAVLGTTVNFGDTASVDLWAKLNVDAQNSVEESTTAYFKDQLESEIIAKSGGDPAKATAIKAMALDSATIKAREFARSATAKAVKDQSNIAVKVDVAKQAKAISDARVVIPSRSTMSSLMGNLNEPQEFVTTRDKVAKGIKNAPTHTSKFTPTVGPDLEKSIKAQATTPQAEWDVVATPDYFRYTRQRQDALHIPEVLDMKQLAEEINAKGTLEDGEGNPTRVAAAKRYYGIAKGLLGFTPEEIKAGKTKHGVEFDSGQIDYKTIPVFRNVAELEKNWNKGDFTPLFQEVGDHIDPKGKMYPEDFYKAQLALLSQRK